MTITSKKMKVDDDDLKTNDNGVTSKKRMILTLTYKKLMMTTMTTKKLMMMRMMPKKRMMMTMTT